MTVMVIITQRVNEALKTRLDPEGRQVLAQACARGATINVLPPAQIKEAILSSLQNECPAIVLVSEGQAAADFQKDIENTLKENMRMVSIFRVVTTPVAHSPDVSCENIIDITEVPTRVTDAIVAFIKIMEEQKNKEVADKPSVTVPQEGDREKQEKQEKESDSEKREQEVGKEMQKERRGFWERLRKGGDEPKKEASPSEKQETDTSAPPSSFPSPSQQVSFPPPPASSQREKKAVVLRFSEIFVCALDEEISQAQKIISQKHRLPIRLIKSHIYQIAMAGVPPEQILVVATRRNVGEVTWPAMFILAEGLTPEEAARYLPDTSKIVAQFVPRRKIADSIAEAVIRLAVGGEINLEAL